MTRAGVCSWFIGLVVALPAAAMADQAYTTSAVNLRAGPDTDYPLVRWVPEGTAVEVHGCLADFRWCDVEAFGDRGWMSASYLVYPYQNSNVPIVTYGAVIGLPLIGFTFDSYWDDHYRRRPWYGERHRWADRYRPEYVQPRYRQPPPPPQYYPPSGRPPQYYPPAGRPPQYYPPEARPPEFRPPPVQQQPRAMPDRQPSYRGRDDRNFPQQQNPGYQNPGNSQPAYRSPGEMRPPMPQTSRPQGPPPSRAPSGRPNQAMEGQGGRNMPGIPDTSGAP